MNSQRDGIVHPQSLIDCGPGIGDAGHRLLQIGIVTYQEEDRPDDYELADMVCYTDGEYDVMDAVRVAKTPAVDTLCAWYAILSPAQQREVRSRLRE